VTDGILYANRQRNSPVKNRMRETCTSGSVRGGDGNIPTYSAIGRPLQRREAFNEEAAEQVEEDATGQEEAGLSSAIRVATGRRPGR
jgi:hypothetical protein